MKKKRKNQRIPRTLRDKVELKVHHHTSEAYKGNAYRSSERLIDWIMEQINQSEKKAYLRGRDYSPQFTERLNEQKENQA